MFSHDNITIQRLFAADDPLDGIRYAGSVLACINFSVVHADVQRDIVTNTYQYLQVQLDQPVALSLINLMVDVCKASIYDTSALLADESNFERPEGMSDEAVAMIFSAKSAENTPVRPCTALYRPVRPCTALYSLVQPFNIKQS